MSDNLPAGQEASQESVASPVTTQTAGETTPQAEKPAGDEGDQPTSDAASDEGQSQDDQPKTWKEKRQERNRQRWQEYKEAKAIMPARLAALENEVARLRGATAPDFSQIQDPTEELAERTAWKVRQQNASEAEARLTSERHAAAAETNAKLAAAWAESVEDARTRIPDFDAVVTDKTPIHERAVPFIVESEKSAEVAYWLGKNPKEAADLYSKFESQPAQALLELGRIEARLSAPEPKRVSTAPKPAKTLAGGAAPLAFDGSKASVGDMQSWLKKSGVI